MAASKKTNAKKPEQLDLEQAANAPAPAEAQGASGQPLFYRNPMPILQDRHANAGLSTEVSYNFAKFTNSIPINVSEFGEACKHYPIAFTGDDNAVPVVIVGLEDKKNLFVNKNGEWVKNAYIPAYIRRFPFALSNIDNTDNMILCVDEASDRYVADAKKKDMPFFEGNEQSSLTKNALAFCGAYHREFMQTRQFSKTLMDSGLLTSRQANVNSKSGKTVSLSGFRTIDEQKFLDLDQKTLAEWHKNGILALINFHILSASNWPKVVELLDKK